MIRLISLRFFESFFRHVWLYLLPIVIMVTLAIVYILVKPPQYLSWGTFYIQDESLLSSMNSLRDRGFNFATPSQIAVAEISELFNSDAFMRAVAQQTDLEELMTADRQTVEQTLSGMRQATWVQSTGERMVFIGTAHEDPQLAYQLTKSTMDTYTQWKINVSQYDSAEAQRFFAELVENYRNDLNPIRDEFTEYLITHPEPVRGERPALEIAEIARLQADVTLAEQRVSNAESKEENARLALTQAESDVRQTYLIFDSPILAVDPATSLKDMLITFAVFLFAGVFLSVVGIVGGVFLNRSLQFPLDVEQAFNLPVLASIPEIDFGEAEHLNESRPIGKPSTPQQSMSESRSNGMASTYDPDYDITLTMRIPEQFRAKENKRKRAKGKKRGRKSNRDVVERQEHYILKPAVDGSRVIQPSKNKVTITPSKNGSRK